MGEDLTWGHSGTSLKRVCQSSAISSLYHLFPAIWLHVVLVHDSRCLHEKNGIYFRMRNQCCPSKELMLHLLLVWRIMIPAVLLINSRECKGLCLIVSESEFCLRLQNLFIFSWSYFQVLGSLKPYIPSNLFSFKEKISQFCHLRILAFHCNLCLYMGLKYVISAIPCKCRAAIC